MFLKLFKDYWFSLKHDSYSLGKGGKKKKPLHTIVLLLRLQSANMHYNLCDLGKLKILAAY